MIFSYSAVLGTDTLSEYLPALQFLSIYGHWLQRKISVISGGILREKHPDKEHLQPLSEKNHTSYRANISCMFQLRDSFRFRQISFLPRGYLLKTDRKSDSRQHP